jgi:phosphomethylpyrimidine synthase
MKISAEVREFAKAQEAKAVVSETEADLSAEALAEAEAGMAEMSERYRESGDLYVPTAE